MKKNKNNTIADWLDKHGDPEIMKQVEEQMLKEHLEYLRSDEAIKNKKDNVLDSIAEYLSHKYKCTVTLQDDTFKIEGLKDEDKKNLIEEVSELGSL